MEELMMNLRRLAAVSLALLVVLSGLSFSCPSARAEREWTPGNLTWNLSDDGTLTITAMNPSAWNNYMNDFDSESPAPWLIDDNGNDHRDLIKKVVLGPGIRNCGEYAFEYCKNLTTVEMAADSVKLIGTRAFGECKKLKTIRFSGNLEGIFSWAFEGCSGLSSVTLPASLQTIEDAAFASCNLSSVKVAEGTEVKTWDFFYPCKENEAYLYHIALPAKVRSVGWGAFAYNPLPHDSLDIKFNIPSGVTKIGEDAFAGCDSVKYMFIPALTAIIGDSAFPEGTRIITYYASDSVREFARNNGIILLELEDPYGGNG